MSNRILAAIAVVASASIVALGWFLGIAPRLADAASAEADRQSVVAQNAVLELQLVQLRDEFERIEELRDEVTELRASIPADADYDGFVAELNALSASTGAGLSRLSIGDASWYSTAVAEAAPADGAETVSPEGVAQGVAGGAAASAAAPAADANVSVPVDTGLVNGSNFVAIPVTLELAADYDQAVALMGALQADKRLFLVTGFSFGGAAPPRIDGLLYVLLPARAAG